MYHYPAFTAGGPDVSDAPLHLALHMLGLGYAAERWASGDCRNCTHGEEHGDRRVLEGRRTSVTATQMVVFVKRALSLADPGPSLSDVSHAPVCVCSISACNTCAAP